MSVYIFCVSRSQLFVGKSVSKQWIWLDLVQWSSGEILAETGLRGPPERLENGYYGLNRYNDKMLIPF